MIQNRRPIHFEQERFGKGNVVGERHGEQAAEVVELQLAASGRIGLQALVLGPSAPSRKRECVRQEERFPEGDWDVEALQQMHDRCFGRVWQLVNKASESGQPEDLDPSIDLGRVSPGLIQRKVLPRAWPGRLPLVVVSGTVLADFVFYDLGPVHLDVSGQTSGNGRDSRKR